MPPGKYAKVLGGLPHDLGTEPEYQEKVNAVKEMILSPYQEGDREPGLLEIENRLSIIAREAQLLYDLMVRRTLGKRHGSAFAGAFKELRQIKDAIGDVESDVNLLIESYKQLIVEQFEAEGVTNIRLTSGGAVRVQAKPAARVTDREVFRLWCIANGLERSLALHPSTTSSLVCARLLEGQPPPDGVDAVVRDTLVLTKD